MAGGGGAGRLPPEPGVLPATGGPGRYDIGLYEAFDLGASRAVVWHKLEIGQWERPYRAVFQDAAAPPTGYRDLRAAYLATGRQGTVSHRSAAWVWGLLPRPPEQPELSVRRGARDVRIPGITVHKSRDLDVATAATRHGIFVTNPLRTLVDLAGLAQPETLTDAVDAALASGLVTVTGLTAELERVARRRRPGVEAFRRHLTERGFIGAPSPSVLEAKLRRLVRSLGIPLPNIEARAGEDGQYRLDSAWPAVWLIAEVDGYSWHFSPEHKRRDDRRRNHLQQQGWTVLVFSWRDLVRDPARVAAEIVAMYHCCSQRVAG